MIINLSIIFYPHANPVFMFIVYNSCDKSLNAYGIRT